MPNCLSACLCPLWRIRAFGKSGLGYVDVLCCIYRTLICSPQPGKERDLVFSLMRKALDLEFSARPLQIFSTFQRDSLPGMIYVEAHSAKQVADACNGLVGVYPSRGIVLVPIDEMASLLQIKKQDLTVTPGSWVRIKRGKYQGDLAQVMDVTENGEEVGLKFIPRIDLNPKDDASLDTLGKKRKKGTTGLTSFSMRPPQRFFNYEEVVKVYGRKGVSKRNQVYVFQNDTYRDGFIEKDFRLNALQLDDVNPTLDEITRFTHGQDGTETDANVDLSIIAEASRKAAISVLQPGDHVEVFEGEQAGVHGTVHSIEQDIVSIQPVGVDLEGHRIQLPARSVRKRFKPGDHVKVMTGQNSDETGLVVSVIDNVVTFLSDMSMQEVCSYYYSASYCHSHKFSRCLCSRKTSEKQQRLARERMLSGTTSYTIWYSSSTLSLDYVSLQILSPL